MRTQPYATSAAHGGFTLPELLMVITIVAILAAISAPGFSLLLEKQRMVTATNELFAAINLTRSEAIQRGARVDLLPVDGTNWSNGWMVLVDENANQKADSGEKIVFIHGAVPAGISITSNFIDDSPKYLAYNGTGRPRTNADSQSIQSGSFFLQSTNVNRRIVINYLGRPYTCTPAVGKSTC